MSSIEDARQLLQNTQKLMLGVATASETALHFAKEALNKPPGHLEGSGPKAEIAKLGIQALREGAQAAHIASALGAQCVELTRSLERDQRSERLQHRRPKTKHGPKC